VWLRIGRAGIVADLRTFFAAAEQHIAGRRFPDHGDWLEEIEALKRAWPDSRELAGIPGINPNTFMHRLSEVSAPRPVQKLIWLPGCS